MSARVFTILSVSSKINNLDLKAETFSIGLKNANPNLYVCNEMLTVCVFMAYMCIALVHEFNLDK